MTSSRSYYEILGVDPSADLSTLKKAVHRLSKILHPDTTLLPINEAAKKFRQVCEAYQSLSDPISRKLYDKTLQQEKFLTHAYMNRSNTREKSKISNGTLQNLGNRRPFSGGELFALLLLCFALISSLFLGIGFALLDGRELQVNPSWLNSNQPFINDSPSLNRDVNFASS